MQDRRQVPA